MYRVVVRSPAGEDLFVSEKMHDTFAAAAKESADTLDKFGYNKRPERFNATFGVCGEDGYFVNPNGTRAEELPKPRLAPAPAPALVPDPPNPKADLGWSPVYPPPK